MSTPSIYTIGQLKAFLASRVAALAPIVDGATEHGSTHTRGRYEAYAEVIALIEGIEAHEAAKTARTAPIAGQDIERGECVTIKDGVAYPFPRTADMDAAAQATGGSNGEA